MCVCAVIANQEVGAPRLEDAQKGVRLTISPVVNTKGIPIEPQKEIAPK